MPDASPSSGAADSIAATQPPASEESTAIQAHGVPDQDGDDEDLQPSAMEPPKKKRKKRNKKTAASRGPTALPKSRGTGFEEYYADPPMTLQEAAEEQMDIYAGDLPFEERIQSAIQRFRARRRLQGRAIRYFDEYLFLGGIDTNPGAFAGQDPRDLKDLTPAQRRDATATDAVHGGSAAGPRFYDGNSEHWSVDFAGVAAGFLSTALPRLTGFEPEQVETAVAVVENFLRYALHHDVCPEYAADIEQALRVCGRARAEWPEVLALKAALPGQFNLAAAVTFSVDETGDWAFDGFEPPEGFHPKGAFFSTLALMEEGELFKRVCGIPPPLVVRTFERGLEVFRVERPSEDVVTRFRSLTLDGSRSSTEPVGKAVFKGWVMEDDWDRPPQDAEPREVTLFFDDTVLAHMWPGMKVAATLCELDVGMMFVRTMEAILPSFYTFLPQEMMRSFKAPRASERPAPSVRDPEADEKWLAKEARDG